MARNTSRLNSMCLLLGFDLSAMAKGAYDEAIVDVVSPQSLISAPYTVKVISPSSFCPNEA